MESNHVVLWLGHRETHIIAFAGETSETPVILHAAQQYEQCADNNGSGNPAEHREYYEQIIEKICEIPQWLVAGPPSAKMLFTKHLHMRHAHLADHLIGLETVDRPSDGQLLAFARKYFVGAVRTAGLAAAA